jgi:alpha-ketoglutarate-dependent taurine dioxygenase
MTVTPVSATEARASLDMSEWRGLVGARDLAGRLASAEAASRLLERTDALSSPWKDTAAQLDSDIRRQGWGLARWRGLEQLDTAERDCAVAAFCLLLGGLSPVGATTDLVVWDVRPRPDLAAEHRKGNISVNTGEAVLHTDSAFSDQPESLFSLWCLQPARDGGASVLVDGLVVLEQLRGTAGGRAAVRLLSEPVVPTLVGGTVRHLAIFDGTNPPVIRYRPDLMEAGLAVESEALRPAVLDAFTRLQRTIDGVARERIALGRGDALFVDNHRMFHAREHFSDQGRHLLRLRMRRRGAM